VDGEHVKLAGLAVIALAGCGRAVAQTPEPAVLDVAAVITVPSTWASQPTIAAAAEHAVPAGAMAWGDPGRGCFAAIVGVRGERQSVAAALEQTRRNLSTTLGLTDWSATASEGRGLVARGTMRGIVRTAALSASTGTAVIIATCVANPRGPDACLALCQGVMTTFDPAKAIL
jgi:hypothetical protein